MKKIIINSTTYWYHKKSNWLYHDYKGQKAVFISNFTYEQKKKIREQINN